MSKVAEVIKELQQKFNPDDDIIVNFWDYERVMNILGTIEYYPEDSKGAVENWNDKELTKEQFSYFAEEVERYSNWGIIAEYFGDIYEDWKDSK